ncbi:MAG TPA: cache domain-containing protein [Spirochaetota bacterium]|nr:cache domain-containing protein [Spirochaetota bacterium]
MKIKFRNSLRNKILFGFLLLVLATGGSSLFIGYQTIYKGLLSQAYETVRSDLSTAEYLYYNRLYQNKMAIGYMSRVEYMKKAILSENGTFLYNKFMEVKDYLGIDILIITDARGKVIQRINNKGFKGDNVLQIDPIRQAIETGKQISGTSILSHEIISREGKEIAEKVLVKIIPTEKGRKPEKEYEERALVLNTATPVLVNNKVIGVLYGATIKNNNFEIVDRIQTLFFRKGGRLQKNKQIGTVTIFLEDIRISTNVISSEGERTVGTLVSEEVYDRVFKNGEMWIDRAFVVDKWYIAGYTPLADTTGKTVGILYVGVPSDNYRWMQTNTASYVLLITIITSLFAIFVSVYLLKRIIKPINEVVEMSDIIAEGDYSSKLRQFSEYELSHLSSAFNRMTDAIYERDCRIKETAQNQIAQSEKLASLGRLASGIAHEINNPLTGILTYSSMLKEDLADSQYIDDLQIIIDETMRCRKIVRGVLDFARETSLEKQPLDLNKALVTAVRIIEKHITFQNVNIIKSFSPDIPHVNVDLDQMKSVFNNLLVNAADAMPEGGDLTISTSYNPAEKMVYVSFSDTGTGIPEEHLDKIFDPFFTTKEPGKGTGLGLSVIYGIIEKHNGSISVKSTPGEGTVFTIKLPAGEDETFCS